MKKIAGFQRQDTAVGFYRVIQPLRFMQRTKLIEEARILPFTGDLDKQLQKIEWVDKVYMEMSKDATAFITDMVWKDEIFLKILDIRKWSGAKWIIDIDDNIFGVTRDNPAYTGLQQALPKMQRSLQLADGISVSVPSLKELYKPFNKNIYVNPNGIDFSWWDKLERQKQKGIRIGWRGASGHTHDRDLVIPAMREITRNYDAKFVVFCQFDPHFDFPYEWQHYVPFFGNQDPNDPSKHAPDYPEVLASLNLDIAVVPLTDSGYNRGKSNLAYLEFSALHVPTVLSPVENQLNMKALYAKTNYEWYEQLEKLVKNRKYREELGEQTYKFIHENYNMNKLVKPFTEWIEKLPYRTDVEPR